MDYYYYYYYCLLDILVVELNVSLHTLLCHNVITCITRYKIPTLLPRNLI